MSAEIAKAKSKLQYAQQHILDGTWLLPDVGHAVSISQTALGSGSVSHNSMPWLAMAYDNSEC